MRRSFYIRLALFDFITEWVTCSRAEAAHSNQRKGGVEAQGDSIKQSRMLCPNCGKHSMQRDHRVGFLERVVFPWFNRYPWECVNCRTRRLLKVRGTHRRKIS